MEMEITEWLELPRDVILTIISKLEPFEILESFQFVCKLWYSLSKDPSLWHSVRFYNFNKPKFRPKYENMVRIAVDRSDGGLYHLDIQGFGSDDLISYVAARSSQLRSLRLADCYYISAKVLIEALGKLKSLEELELTHHGFPTDFTLAIIRACSALRTFKLIDSNTDKQIFALDDEALAIARDDEALAIAENMPDVRHLQLFGNSMTNDGLKAIIERCPHLQSLDVRACYNLDLVDLGNSFLARIKDFRFEFTQYDSDFGHIFADDYDFLMDLEYETPGENGDTE